MDYHNRKEGLKEALLDVEEGADIIMVKPAMSYLDIVREVADTVIFLWRPTVSAENTLW